MDEVEVQGTPGSTATETVGGSGTLQGSTLQEDDSSDGAEKGADTPLCDDSEHGASSDNGRREDEAGTLLLPQGLVDDDLEPERAGPTAMLGDGVDGTAPEAPTYDPSGDSSATTRTIDNPRETIQASLTHEEDDSVPDHHAHEQEALSSLEPVGHLEHEVASPPPETSVTEENSETATSSDMAAPKKILPEGEEGIILHEQQTDAVSELSAAATDIHEEPGRSGINNTVESSEAVVEKKAVQTSEGPSGSDSGTPSASTPEGGVLASSTEDASGRASTIVTESGSEGVVVGDSGASEGGVELLPAVAAAGEELLTGGTSSSGVVSTSRTTSSTTQESAPGFAVSRASTGDVLQPKPDSKDSRVVLTPEGAGVGCTLGDPAPASHILIEAIVAKYLSLAAAEAVAVVVAVPKADVPAPDEVSGNRLESRGSSSALEEKQDDVSASTENVVEPPEPGSLPVSDDAPDATEAGVARGDDSTSAVKAVASQASVESIVVRDYLEQTLPITTMAEIAAKATLGDRSLAPEPAGVICLDEAVNPTSERGASGEGDEAERSGLTLAEDLEEKSLRPDLAEDREGGGIEKVQGEGVPDRSEPDSHFSEPDSPLSENARTLVDEVIAQSLVAVAAVVTARVRDVSYGCASPAPKNLVRDACVPLCKSSLEDKCSTEGTQTPRTLPSESASTGSVSCQDRDNITESEFSPSTPEGAESLRTSNIADGGAVTGLETPQAGVPLTPESGGSTAEHVTEPRLGGTDNGLAELSSQQGDLPAAENSAPAEELEWRPSASAAIDDGVYITNADTDTIDCERFVPPIPDSPISAETRAAADYVEHVVREATSAAFRAQGVGKTTSDTSGSLSTTAQVQPQRITRDPDIITSSEEESPAVLAKSAEVDGGEETPIDADGVPAVANLNDQEELTDSGNPSLPSSGSLQASADADSIVGACGSAVAARDAKALDPAAPSVPSDPSPNGDEPFAGASGTDSEHEQGTESSGPPPTEPAAYPAVAAALEPGVDRAADTAMPVTIESAGDLPPTPIGQEVPADPPLLSPSVEDPCCSSTLLPDSSDGGNVLSPEIPTAVQEVRSTSEEAPVGLHASCGPCSSTALRCRVVDDFLSEKLCETVAAETASQVSAKTIEPRLHDEHRHSGEVEGHSGVDQRLAEESRDAARSPPLRVEQGTPGEEVLGSIDQEDKLLPDASQGVARSQLTPPSNDTLSCIPPANEAEGGPRPPPEEEHAPTLSSSTPPSVQGHDCSSSGRSDDPTDGEVQSSQTPTTPEVVEKSSTETRVSNDASDKTSPPATLRYKVMTGCLSDEVSGAVATDAVVSSRSSRACDLEPTTGLRSEAGVNSDANDDRPPSASLRCEVVTGLLSDEVRGVAAAADAAVSSTSSRACGLETSTGVRSEARVGSDANDKPPSSASPRYVVVTGCLSDEVRGVVAADTVASSGTSGARGLDSTTGVPGEAWIDSDTVERDQAEERDVVVGPSESPTPQDTPQQDLSNSIRPEVEIKPEPTPKSAETPPPCSSTEIVDNDSTTIYHPDDPVDAGIRQLETLETAAVLSEEVEERIGQGLSGVSSSSVSLLRDAVVANYLAGKLREIVVAGVATSVSCSTRCDLGLVSDAQSDQPVPSAPPGGVLGTVPAASNAVVSNSESSAREDDASLTVDLPLAETAEAEQLPADEIEPSLPDEKQQSREAQAESGADGDGGKEGSEDSQPTATPMPPPTVLEKTPLRSAEPDNESESNHPLVNVEPLASAAEVMSCPQEAEAQTKALEAGAAEDRADAVAWLAGAGSTPKSMQAKASEDRAGAVAWLHNLGQQETRVQGVRLDASAWLREAGEEAQTKALEAGAADDRADAVAWLAGAGGTAKSMQAKASEDRAGAVAWLHNLGEQETRVQGVRLDASAWLRETGEKEVSLQDKAEEARFDAVEWLTTKGAAELQRTRPTERPGTASQQHLNGDGVDQRTRTESKTSDKDTAEPYLQVPEKPPSGDCNCVPTASSEQQPSELSAIDVARETGEEKFLGDTVHPETDNKAPFLCPAESHGIEDDPAATTHPLPCRSAVSVIGDPDVKVSVDRPALGDWSAPPPCLETTATARVPHDNAVATTELDPQESSQMLAVGENDWSRVSLSRTPPFDALNSPSIALRWEPAGKPTRSLPPDIGGFDSTASSATIADQVVASGSAAAASTAAAAGVSGYAAVPSNNVGSEWVGFFAPPHRMAPTGDAYGVDSVCSAEASASSTARRNSTGSTLPSYVSGETGDERIPRENDDRRTINENEEHLERGGASCGARGAERWMSPPAGPRRNGDCKRWNKVAERSRRYARRWQSFLSRVHRHFDSEVQLRKKLSIIRRAHPDVSNEVAFVALAQSHGRASEAAAVLHLSRAKEEATLVTTMLDVASFIRLTREAADARRRSLQIEEHQPTSTSKPQSEVVRRAHYHGRGEKQQQQQQQQQQQHSHPTHHLQQLEHRRERAEQQRQREGSFLSSDSVGFGGLSGGSTDANVDAHGSEVGVIPEIAGEKLDRGRRRRLRGRPVPTGIDHSCRRMWSRGSESSPALLPPIARLTDGTPPTPETLKTVLATSTSVALEIPEGFGLTAEFGKSIKRDSDQGHAIKGTKRAQRAVLRARARFQRQRMAEIAAPTAHQNGSGLDAVTERFLLETGTLDRDSRDLNNRLRAPKRDSWGQGTLVYGDQIVGGSGHKGAHSSSALLASLDTAQCGEAAGFSGMSPSNASAETAVGYDDRRSCRVQNYFTQALTEDGFYRGKRRGGGGGGRAVPGGVRAPRK